MTEVKVPNNIVVETKAFIRINAIPIFDRFCGFTSTYLYARRDAATKQPTKKGILSSIQIPSAIRQTTETTSNVWEIRKEVTIPNLLATECNPVRL